MPCVVVIFVAAVVVIIVVSIIQGQKHRDALAAFAAERGLSFSADDPFDIEDRFEGFSLISSGHSRGASNVLWGDAGGRRVMLFEYRYKTGSGKNESTHWHVCCIWTLPVPLADMAIRPEGLFDRMAEWFGHNDIDFESSEFSSRYHVKGSDRREVYAVITPRMMEFMLSSDFKYLEVLGEAALVYSDESSLTPQLCEWLLALADGFDRNIPEHVIRDKQRQRSLPHGT